MGTNPNHFLLIEEGYLILMVLKIYYLSLRKQLETIQTFLMKRMCDI